MVIQIKNFNFLKFTDVDESDGAAAGVCTAAGALSKRVASHRVRYLFCTSTYPLIISPSHGENSLSKYVVIIHPLPSVFITIDL